MILTTNRFNGENVLFNSDTAVKKRVELNAHTQMSAMDSVLSVKELIHTAARWGWNAIAITDLGTVQAFPEAMKIVKYSNLDIKVIYGMEGYLTDNDNKNASVKNITLLAKNKAGLHNLYKIVSLSHIRFFRHRPCIPQRALNDNREGLLLGSAGLNGELVQAIASRKNHEDILKIAGLYDYLEIQPSENYAALLNDDSFPDISSDDDLRDINRRIVELSEALGKPTVATGDVYYLSPEDYVCRNIILKAADKENNDVRASRFLRTTDEMLENLGYLGKEAAYNAVVLNPRRIADMIERFDPIPEGRYLPTLQIADEIVKSTAYEKAHSLYGQNLPASIQSRLDDELKIIVEHGYPSLFWISQELAKKAHDDGSPTCSRGLVGSSLVAYLIGITEVNPLPPHWRCPKCRHSEFVTDGAYASGFDLPNRNCPNCGESLIKDGHDIPYAVLLGFGGEKLPDIDINFPRQQVPIVRKYAKRLLGEDKVYDAGTIETLSYEDIDAYIRSYCGEDDTKSTTPPLQEIKKRLIGVKKMTGTHSAAVTVIPQNMDVHCFTPIQHTEDEADDEFLTTHFDYHSLAGTLLKLDILGYTALDILKQLADKTHCPLSDIPFDDTATLSLFRSTDSLGVSIGIEGFDIGTLGIMEFDSPTARQILSSTKPNCFSELVKISALSHGTGTWEDNAEKLIRSGVCTLNDVIATRDDVMMYLIGKGIKSLDAFNVMEAVRKGKGISQDTAEMLKSHDVPEWYIESCQKIMYLFPRAHVVDYVTTAYRLAYYKVHYSAEFYRAYFEVCAEEADMTVIKAGKEAVQEQLKKIEILDSYDEEDDDRKELFALALEMYLGGYLI